MIYFLLISLFINFGSIFLLTILYIKNNKNINNIFYLNDKISFFENEKIEYNEKMNKVILEKSQIFENLKKLEENFNNINIENIRLKTENTSKEHMNSLYLIDIKSKNNELDDIRQKNNLLISENSKFKSECDLRNENNNNLVLEIKELNSRIYDLEEQIKKKISENSSLLSEKNTISENLKNINEILLPQFKNISMNLLKENSDRFKNDSSEKIQNLLNPLNEKIKDFKERMENIFNEDNKEKSSLKEAINSIINSNENIRRETFKLSNALKGNRLMLGHWGEIVLENILNSSGLRKDHDYFLQASNTNQNESDQASQKLKPDALIKLPDDKYVIIDSKISFFNNSGYEDATSNDEKMLFVKQFVSGLKSHIESLSSKEYHLNLGLDTPEMTLMFIPIESWYNIAIKHFPDIYNFAWNKNIAIVSPSTLFVVLKIIAYIWKGKLQAKNSFEIASMGGKIYDSIVEFSETLLEIGKSIEKANISFEKAMSKLKHGRGNLISRAEKLRSLGVKNNKIISSDLIENNIENEKNLVN
jgi:DNA recombination protein RmuC